MGFLYRILVIVYKFCPNFDSSFHDNGNSIELRMFVRKNKNSMNTAFLFVRLTCVYLIHHVLVLLQLCIFFVKNHGNFRFRVTDQVFLCRLAFQQNNNEGLLFFIFFCSACCWIS